MKNIMEQPKPVPFYNLCRLCLENEGLTKICSKEGLARDVYLCTGVVVSSQDNLPQKICYKCVEIVVNAKWLRDKTTATDRHLKSLFVDDEPLSLGLNRSETDPAEQISNSRRSSTDSDRTIKLEIDETQFCVNEEEGEEKEVEAVKEEEEEDIKPKKRKTRRSDSSETSESSRPKKKITVRKDLFNGSQTSSVRRRRSLVSPASKKRKAWDPDQMKKAIEAVRTKVMGYKRAAKTLSVPISTLKRLAKDSQQSLDLLVRKPLGRKPIKKIG